MFGTLAAQSIGEPTTQMTLNIFSKNVTLGVPRSKESSTETPSLPVYLVLELARDPILAKNIQQELAYTSLRTVTVAVEIRYNPVPTATIIPEDEAFVADEDIEAKLHPQSPRLLRLELNQMNTIDPKFIMAYVAGRIAECFKTDLIVIWSEANSERLVIHWVGGMDVIEENISLRIRSSTP